ncbi:hypothetical protein ACTG16_23340 [Aeromonas sp. 23P]|uniref:hypothetical protein n=1 Tax=Aeromonas sp. 23P TaxID=3452716 RepID=UPI003F7A479F
MQRFFVLGEHTLCTVSGKPDIGQFLNGPLTFPLTALVVTEASPYKPEQVIQPEGRPLLRLATINDVRAYFIGIPVSDKLLSGIAEQDRETEQTVEALSALAPSLRESMDGARKRFAQCMKDAASLPSAYKMDMDAREHLTKAITHGLTAAELMAQSGTEALSSLFHAIKQGTNGVLAAPFEGEVPELAPAIVKEAKAIQGSDPGANSGDPTPVIADALLSCHERIVSYHKVMGVMWQHQVQMEALAKEARELHQTMYQSCYNYWVLDRLLMAGGLTHNVVSNNPAAKFDWENIEADAYNVQSLAHGAKHVIDGLVGQLRDFNAKLAWYESTIPTIS